MHRISRSIKKLNKFRCGIVCLQFGIYLLVICIYNWIYQSGSTLLQAISLESFLISQQKFPCPENKSTFLKFPMQTIPILEMQKGKRKKLGKRKGQRKTTKKILLVFCFFFFFLELWEGKKKEGGVCAKYGEQYNLSEESVLKFKVLLKIRMYRMQGFWGVQTAISLQPQLTIVCISLSHYVQKDFTLERPQQ